MNLIGKMLGSRYEILEKIGAGGMATVYRAKCHVLKRDVAVKILRDEFTTDNEFIKRFNAEAQAAASLTHPNIVSVYDVGHEGNLYYIVMELVKGKTLKEIIVEEGALPWKWSIDLAVQIARGLEKAHRNGIIHRDIKPHNIIITEEGIAKVADFGIAKAVSNATITAFGVTTGSVHYFSPEHARGGYTDQKSDLYSLGVVLYEMVTGRVPFDADTPVSVALKHMQENPEEPININSSIPMSLNRIILKAMQKEPSMRYQDATEMINDLETCLKEEAGTVVKEIEETDEFATKRISLNYEDTNNKTNKKEGKFAKIKNYFKKHPFQKWIAILFGCMLVFVLAVVITLFALNASKVKDTVLPNFAEMTLEEAEAKAKEAKLKLEIEEDFHIEIEAGKVISQEPPYQENYKVKEGSTVKLVISKGQEMVEMIKVVGMKKDESINELKKIGLIAEIEEEYSDKVEKDIVIEQEKEEGEEVLKGSSIKIKVSSGVEQVEVPDLKGKTEEEAKSAITGAKLKWKSTSKISDSGKPNGVVVDQSISAGSMVDKETEVTITLNEFDEIKNGTITVNVASILNYSVKKDEEGNEIPPKNVQVVLSFDNQEYATKDTTESNTGLVFNVSSSGSKAAKIQIKSSSGNIITTREFTYNSGDNKPV